MNEKSDREYFKLRKEGKTYLSKVFAAQHGLKERLRFVTMVMDDSDSVLLGEIEGALCLRVSGSVRKTQVTALVSQDSREVRRLSLQTFNSRSNKTGEYFEGTEKEEFSFRGEEFDRLLKFLNEIKFADFSNTYGFQIEDISTQSGPKVIIDASDRGLLHSLKSMSVDDRRNLFASLRSSLSADEINILLGRKSGLQEFEVQMANGSWNEVQWQGFFEREQWVFGYGLDYRVMRHFDREVTVGQGGTDNQNRPVVDFLMNFTDYSVLVEIKRPDTPIFKRRKSGRAGTWEFSAEFVGAVSQVLEQKAEWLSSADSGEHYSRDGTERLRTRTRNAKTILVVGSRAEFLDDSNIREQQIKLDTFELFRRECGGIDIITFDELLDRAQFINRSEAKTTVTPA